MYFFLCLRVHVDLIQRLADRNNKRCFLVCLYDQPRFEANVKTKMAAFMQFRTHSKGGRQYCFSGNYIGLEDKRRELYIDSVCTSAAEPGI